MIRSVDDLKDDIVDQVASSFDEWFPGVFGGLCDPKLFRWKLGLTNPNV